MTDFEMVRDMALKLPDVKATESPRGLGLKVRGKLMACTATHKSAEPNTLMVRVSVAEREKRIAEDPEVYYLTDHYRDYPALLVRLTKINRKSLENLLGCSWQFIYEKSTAS